MKLRVIDTVKEWREVFNAPTTTVGFVPTMGALHAGHVALCERARRENSISVASIFVNPTQFNDPEDFKKYPKTWERDLELLEAAGVHYLFAPAPEQIYPDQYRYQLTETVESRSREGAHRPGHFDGVLTVVLKLFQIIRPQRAYFGEKDYQQLQLISGMVNAFFLPIQVVACATVREDDGLALSSRNRRLSDAGRARAPEIYRALRNFPSAVTARDHLIQQGFEVEYVEDFKQRRFAAVKLDNVRLIDNVEISS